MTRSANVKLLVLGVVSLMVVAAGLFALLKPSKEKWMYDEEVLLDIERNLAKIFGGQPLQQKARSIDPLGYSIESDPGKLKENELKPDPSVFKWYPLHSSEHDPFRSLRLNGGTCVSRAASHSSHRNRNERDRLCTQNYHKLECQGEKQEGNRSVECVWKAPLTMSDWLEHQKCVTFVPQSIDIETDSDSPRYITGNQFTERDLKPQTCATALQNPSNRLNVIAIYKLKLDDRGRNLGKDRTQLFNTKSDGKGYGMQMTADIHDGTLSNFRINEMGFQYKVGDLIFLDVGSGKSPVWTVTERNILPAVLNYDDDFASRNFETDYQDEYPEKVVQYLFNPTGMTDLELFKAWNNACTAVCTNGTSTCFNSCIPKAPDRALNAGRRFQQ